MWYEIKDTDLPEELKKNGKKMGAVLYKNFGICIFRIWVVHCRNIWLVNGDSDQKYLMHNDSENDIKKVIMKNVKENDRYYFLIETENGEIISRRDPYARYTEYETDKCFVIDFLTRREIMKAKKSNIIDKNSLIIYELHVESYIKKYKETFNQNNLKETFFKQIADYALDYIKELNFNCIELMPVIEYCGEWGYNPRLMMCINSKLGTVEDFIYLIDKFHENGIYIIVDVVIHHAASRMNSLWNFDGYNYQGGIYFENGGDTNWGAKFNFQKKEVRDMLYSVCDVLLGEYGVDGIRFDSVHNIPNWLLKSITSQLKIEYRNCFLMAEVVPENPNYLKECGFDSCWIHSSYYDVISQYRNQKSIDDWKNGYCRSMIQGHQGFSSPSQCVLTMLGNHDQIGNRCNGNHPNGDDRIGKYVVDQFGGRTNWDSRAYNRLLYSLSCISFGIPMLFMGTENLQGEWWSVKDINHNYNWSLVKNNDQITKEMRRLVRDINYIKLKEKEIFCSNFNNFKEFNINPNHFLVTFIREGNNSACLCVVNMDRLEWLDNNYCVKVTKYISEKYGNRIIQIFNSQSEEYGGWNGSYTAPTKGIINCVEFNNFRESESTSFLLNIPKYSVTIYKFQK